MTFIAVPAAPIVWSGSLSGSIPTSSTATLTPAEVSDPNGIASISGTTIVVSKPGTYVVYAQAHSTTQQFDDNFTWKLDVMLNGVAQTSDATGDTTPVNGNNNSGHSRTHAVVRVTCAAGNTIAIRGTNTAGFASEVLSDGFVELIFIPTFANPS